MYRYPVLTGQPPESAAPMASLELHESKPKGEDSGKRRVIATQRPLNTAHASRKAGSSSCHVARHFCEKVTLLHMLSTEPTSGE